MFDFVFEFYQSAGGVSSIYKAIKSDDISAEIYAITERKGVLNLDVNSDDAHHFGRVSLDYNFYEVSFTPDND